MSISQISDTKPVHVAVGVIINNLQEVLIAKRAIHLHQGGLWEFPGGKVERNETVQEALSRELNEELGIIVETASRLIEISHHYADKFVFLDVWLIEKFTGKAQGNESQPLLWVPIGELKNYPVPEANREIVSALEIKYKKFPREILITGDWENLDDYLFKLQQALKPGISWVHLRAHACSYDEYHALHELSMELCKQSGAKLTVNTSFEWFQRLRATGLHFTSERLLNCDSRPVDKFTLFGASCHNLVELRHAENIDADYIMLGPVFKTATHPDHESIGLDKFADWARQCKIPVFALGGLTPNDLASVISADGYGIAAIQCYWKG